MCGFYRRWTGNSSNPVLRWHSTNTAMPWWTFFPRRLTAASTCFDRVRIIFPRFQRVDFYEKLDGHCVGYKLNTAAIKNGRIPNSIFSVASTHFSPLSSPLKQKSKFFSLIFSLLWMQMKSRTSDTRISAVWTSKSRKFAKQWSCRWRTLSCTSRSGLTRRVASSSTGLRAAARPCWPKPSRITPLVRRHIDFCGCEAFFLPRWSLQLPSSVWSGRSSCRSTWARGRGWCATCSVWPRKIRPPSSSSTRSTPSPRSVSTRRPGRIAKSSASCWNCWIRWTDSIKAPTSR